MIRNTDASHLYDGAAGRDDWDGEVYARGTDSTAELSASGAQSSFIKSSDVSMLGFHTVENDYEGMGFFQSDLRRQHSLEDAAHKDAVLDPGGAKFREFKRREDKASAEHRKAQRREQRIAKKLGYNSVDEMPIEELEAELHRQEDVAGDEQLRAEVVRQMMADPSYPKTRGGCYKRLKRITQDEKDELEHRARVALQGVGSGEGRRLRSQRKPVNELPPPPLPRRQPGLTERARIVAERDVDKGAVRAQLEEDVQAFLEAGGVIEQLDPWMPEDERYIFQGKIKPVPFNRWGYSSSRGGSRKKPLKSERSRNDSRAEPADGDITDHDQLMGEAVKSAPSSFEPANQHFHEPKRKQL